MAEDGARLDCSAGAGRDATPLEVGLLDLLGPDSSPNRSAAEAETIDQKGACYCGAVGFSVRGGIFFNGLCHCKACSRARGVSPLHLIAVTPPEALQILKGEEGLVTHRGYRGAFGQMTHRFCGACGCLIDQGPEGAPFRAVLPVNFHLEDGKSCVLPEKYKPKLHVNYENRMMDWHDSLPKYKVFHFEGAIRVNNAGEEIADPAMACRQIECKKEE